MTYLNRKRAPRRTNPSQKRGDDFKPAVRKDLNRWIVSITGVTGEQELTNHHAAIPDELPHCSETLSFRPALKWSNQAG
ncbi:MAG: hypothetical protein R3C18_15515 [Planctomycetaceae bacterium]